jgi:hypothetical protein
VSESKSTYIFELIKISISSDGPNYLKMLETLPSNFGSLWNSAATSFSNAIFLLFFGS